VKHLIKIILFFFGFSFVSCDKLVTNIEPPKTEKQLVLFAFLSPEETTITAELSYSSPVFGTSNFGEVDYIPNALVVISNNDGNSDTLIYNSVSKAYESLSAFKIEPGKTYKIKATYDGKSAEGTTAVPNQLVLIDTIEVLKSVGSQGENKIKIKTIWDDPGVKGLYYRIYNEQEYSFGSGEKSAYGVCSEFISNAGKENKRMNSICESSYFNDGGSGSNSINIYLLTTDIHYYEYNRRRVNYFGDDPFSEPVPQYMNVKGGLGVVSSFRRTKIGIKP
jgi:hypothetical protein